MKSIVEAVLVVLVLAEGICSSPPCTSEGLDQCNLPVLGTDIIPEITDTELNDICSSWESVHQPCIDKLSEACGTDMDGNHGNGGNEAGSNDVTEGNPTTTPSLGEEDENADFELEIEKKTTLQASRELQGGYKHICDNTQDYKDKMRPCLMNNLDVLTKETATCQEKYHNATWWLNKESHDNVYKYCEAGLDYLSCVKEKSQASCGDSVASWVWDYHRALWEPHLEDVECSAGGGMDAGGIALISICCTAIGLAIIFTIASFIVKPKVVSEDLDLRRNSSAAVLGRNGSVAGITDNGSAKNTSKTDTAEVVVGTSSLAHAPEHGILKHRHTDSMQTKL